MALAKSAAGPGADAVGRVGRDVRHREAAERRREGLAAAEPQALVAAGRRGRRGRRRSRRSRTAPRRAPASPAGSAASSAAGRRARHRRGPGDAGQRHRERRPARRRRARMRGVSSRRGRSRGSPCRSSKIGVIAAPKAALSAGPSRPDAAFAAAAASWNFASAAVKPAGSSQIFGDAALRGRVEACPRGRSRRPPRPWRAARRSPTCHHRAVGELVLQHGAGDRARGAVAAHQRLTHRDGVFGRDRGQATAAAIRPARRRDSVHWGSSFVGGGPRGRAFLEKARRSKHMPAPRPVNSG